MGAGFVLFAYAISAGIGAFLHQSFPEAGRVRDPQPDNQLAIRFSVVFFAVAILFSLCQLWLRKEKAIWALIGSVCGVSMVVLIFYS